MQCNARMTTTTTKKPRYTVKFLPVDMINATRYPDGADAERLAEQNAIRVKLAYIDAHPHRDPRPSPTAHWRRPVTEAEMARAAESVEVMLAETASADAVKIRTLRTAIYRVELSADEVAEAEVQEQAARDRDAALLASERPAPVAKAPRVRAPRVVAPKVETKEQEIRRLEREYKAALNAECRAVEAIPDGANTDPRVIRATKRAWNRADETNRASTRLQVARGEIAPTPLRGAAAAAVARKVAPVAAPVAAVVQTAPEVTIAVDLVRTHNQETADGAHFEILATTSDGRGLGMCGHSHESPDAAIACTWTPGDVEHVRTAHHVKVRARGPRVATPRTVRTVETSAPTSGTVVVSKSGKTNYGDLDKYRARRARQAAAAKARRAGLAVAS